MCYTHVPVVKRDKLGHKSEVGIFLGIIITPKDMSVQFRDKKNSGQQRCEV